MRTTISIVLLQLTAMAGLAAIAVGQSEQASTQQDLVVSQDVGAKQDGNAKQDGEVVVRNGSGWTPTIRKKLEDWLGLTDRKIEDLATAAERLTLEVSKLRVERDQATGVIPTASPLLIARPVAPQQPSPSTTPVTTPSTPLTPISPKAEVDSSESFDSVAGDTTPPESTPSNAAPGDYIDTMPIPVLNGSTPDWVKNGLVSGDDHSFAISSTLMTDLEQCRVDLKSRMMSEVRVYLDKHVLEFSQSNRMSDLTQEYVEKYWVRKGQVFDNIQDRPSGTYHQLWIGLHISSEQLAKIQEWEKETVREQRTRRVGIFGGFGVFAITLLSGAVGLLARREKAKLKG